MIDAMQQVKIPSLAIALAQLPDAVHARVVLLFLGGTVLSARRLQGGEVIDYFFLGLCALFCYCLFVCTAELYFCKFTIIQSPHIIE